MTRGKCKYCGQLNENVEVHQNKCATQNPFECILKIDGRPCGRRFKTLRGLGQHESQSHNAEERGATQKCRHCCWGTFDRRALEEHEEKCRDNRLSRRSRSRSRAPSMSRFVEEGGETPNRGHSRSQSRPTRSNLSQTPSRASVSRATPSRASVANRATPSKATSSRKHTTQSVPIRNELSNRRSTSRVPQFQQVHDNVAAEPELDQMASNSLLPPAPISSDGMYQLRLLDPVKAFAVMSEYNKDLLSIVDRIRATFNGMKQVCAKLGRPDLVNVRLIEREIEDTAKFVLAFEDDDDEDEGSEEETAANALMQ